VRTLLVTGPGGAGSSTVAAATALAAARAGHRTRLLTAGAPAVAGLADEVAVQVVAPGPAVEAAWAGHADQLAALVPALGLPPASSVVPLPGAGEVALLVELGRVAAAGGTDVLVVDAGPVDRATALLGLPAALRWWSAQLAPPRLRVLAAVRSAAGRGRPGVLEAALAALTATEALVDRVPDVEVHLVLPPDPRALPALRGSAAGVGLLGRPLAAATLARVLPGGAGEWAAARAAAQDQVRVELHGTGFPVGELAEAPRPPADVDALTALGVGLPDLPAAPAGPSSRREGTGWVLDVPLPGAGRGEVELTRWGDELVVGVAGVRRSLPLDSLLRRCAVTSASVRDPGTPAAALAVRFVADPAQWPADLLAAEDVRAGAAR
jgi:arsenite-transporting ATPase